jgi:OmcA/MtrC family decaheme c-type cytochrome
VEVGAEQGDWGGLPYLDGTYTADVWLYKNIDLGRQNELQTYRSTSNAGTLDFLYGAATTIVPRAIISAASNCYSCHNDVLFHGGGRRGVDACLTCHAVSGNMSSLVPTATTASVPVEFRQMLHKIHLGADLTDATYPFATHGEFPAMPGGVRQCVRCHGNDAWKVPGPRDHPFAAAPTRTWGVVCGACHDGATAQAHITANTAASGYESCEVCHGPGRDFAVEKVHLPR